MLKEVEGGDCVGTCLHRVRTQLDHIGMWWEWCWSILGWGGDDITAFSDQVGMALECDGMAWTVVEYFRMLSRKVLEYAAAACWCMLRHCWSMLGRCMCVLRQWWDMLGWSWSMLGWCWCMLGKYWYMLGWW